MSRSVRGGINLPDAQSRDVVGQLNSALADVAMLLAGQLAVDISAGSSPRALTSEETRARVVRLTGALAAARTVTVPATETGRAIIFENATTGGFAVTVKLVAEGGAGVSVPAGQNRECYHNDVNMKQTNT